MDLPRLERRAGLGDSKKLSHRYRQRRKAGAGGVVIPPDREPHFGKFMDLNMLVMTGGLEWTEEGFIKLFEASGFLLCASLTPTTQIS